MHDNLILVPSDLMVQISETLIRLTSMIAHSEGCDGSGAAACVRDIRESRITTDEIDISCLRCIHRILAESVYQTVANGSKFTTAFEQALAENGVQSKEIVRRAERLFLEGKP